jgi:hypothetical protein
MGLVLAVRFTEHLQMVAKINYDALINLRTLALTTEQPKSSIFAMASPVVVW